MSIQRLGYLIILAHLWWFTSCSPSVGPSNGLSIFAAASLGDAFADLIAEFEQRHPQAQIELNLAGSQTLRFQIEQGAPADLFASANWTHIRALEQAGLVEPAQVFSRNQLVVIYPPHNPAEIKTLADMTRPGLQLILAAPDVPVGDYAREVLEQLNQQEGTTFASRVLQNVVSDEESVKAVVTKIRLGEADAALVYQTELTATPDLGHLAIPAPFNITAEYPIARTTRAASPELAAQFIAFVRSEVGQEILKGHGFR